MPPMPGKQDIPSLPHLSVTFPPEGDALVGGVADEHGGEAVVAARHSIVLQHEVLWAGAGLAASRS